MKLTVVIPAYNEEKNIERCLKSVRISAADISHELLVVDDGSTDQTSFLADTLADKVIRHDQNKGLRAAREAGRISARGEYIVFVDADVELDKSALPRLCHELTVNPQADAAAVIPSEDIPVAGFVSRYRNSYLHFNCRTCRDGNAFLWGSCYALRKNRSIPFRPGGNYWAEDTEYAHALLENGRKIIVLKDIRLKHYHEYTVRSLLCSGFMLSMAWSRIFGSYGGFRRLIDQKRGFSNAPIELMAAVVMAPLIPASILIQSEALLIFSVTAWLTVNLNYFSYLVKKNGTVFFIKSVPLYFSDCLFRFAGIVTGFLVPEAQRVLASERLECAQENQS